VSPYSAGRSKDVLSERRNFILLTLPSISSAEGKKTYLGISKDLTSIRGASGTTSKVQQKTIGSFSLNVSMSILAGPATFRPCSAIIFLVVFYLKFYILNTFSLFIDSNISEFNSFLLLRSLDLDFEL
jgi:hypothetical protein